jgi:adenosylmethionine-8-amino-7-oxononanoate aminotransferase
MRETNFIAENNARHMWHPMAHPAEMQAHPPRIISAGEGVEIVDIQGKKVLDAVGGLWNVNLGYSCEPVKKAIRDQLDELPYYSTFRGTTNSPLIELSYELAEWFREDGLNRSFFTSGGSDSVETCLRLARQYHKINGQPERTKFVALKKGYHGTHFGGASVNGNQNFRRNYEPLLPGVFHLPAPFAYRNPFGMSDGAEIAAAIGRLFEDEIAFQGADTIAALIASPALLVSVEAALNLAYDDDPYRPDVAEMVGSAFAIAIRDIRERAEDMAGCNSHDNCAAEAVVLERLADWLEAGVIGEADALPLEEAS